MFYRVSAATAAAVLLLSGCGAWQSVSDASSSAYRAVFFKQVKVLDVDLTARAALNPDDAGRPTSVAVRVYQLKDRKIFDRASYEDLLKSDRIVLAHDAQSSMAAVLSPGASVSLSQSMWVNAKYIGVVAFYRNPAIDDGWKCVIDRKNINPDNPLKLEVRESRMSCVE